MSKCKSCGATIRWVVTSGGKKMPLDEKRYTVVTDQGEVVQGHQSHFATCPDADEWRKRYG